MLIKKIILLTTIITMVGFVSISQNITQLKDTTQKISVKADADTKYYNEKKEEAGVTD